MKLLNTIREKLQGENGRFAGDLGFKAVTEICNAVFGILTFAILSRFLVNADYAVVNQTIAVSSLIAPILLVKMNNAFCVFLAGEQDARKIKSRFFSVLLLCLPVSAVLVLVFLLGNTYFSRLMFGIPDYSHLMLLMSLYFVALSLSTLCQSLYQSINRQKKSNVFIIVRVALTTLCFFVLTLVPAWFSLENVLLLYVGIETVVLLLSFFSIVYDYRGVPLRLQFRPLKEYYAYALPLMPYVVMSWINSFIGRFILNHLVDDNLYTSSVFGFYSALVSRAFFINAVLVYTIFPYIAKFWNENNRDKVAFYLRRAFNIGLFFAVPMTLGMVVTTPTLVSLLSGGNYPVNPIAMGLLCGAQIFQMLYMNYSYLIDLSRRTMLYNVIFLISSLINVGLNFALIPSMGLYGAALAMLLSYAVQFVISVFVGSRSAGLRISFDWWQIGKTLLCSAAMYVVCCFTYGAGGMIRFVVTVAVGVGVYFLSSLLLSKVTKTSLM